MKKLVIYVPVLLFCVLTVQLKAEENAVVSSDTPVLTDIQVIDQDPNLSSSLVWDKNKTTKKDKKKNPTLENKCGKMLISAGIPIKRMIINGEISLLEPVTGVILKM